jgi:hypothetical protein
LGWGIKSWITSLSTSLKDLSGNITKLSGVIAGLEREQAVQRVMIAANGREIRKLEAVSCSKVDCPFKNQSLRTHQRFEDAQRLDDLQEQMDDITDSGITLKGTPNGE